MRQIHARTSLALAAALSFSISAGWTAEIIESEFNAAGHPRDGVNPASACCVITRGAIGGFLVADRLSSASYTLDSGIVGLLPPPGQVRNLRFTGETTLAWDPDRSVGTYALYRGEIAALPGSYGSCLQGELTAPEATAGGTPAAGGVFLYLVSASNRIAEEGGIGVDGAGNPRPSPGSNTCP